ncbi:hypothetical protein HDU82_001776 [Entophlyctis luteolus]|nr:hypothetical protein HDU82_001776 [Entophlyctis luteolus]
MTGQLQMGWQQEARIQQQQRSVRARPIKTPEKRQTRKTTNGKKREGEKMRLLVRAHSLAAPTTLTSSLLNPFRAFHPAATAMGVTKEVLRAGDGVNFPKKNDTVTMHYTGTLAANGSKFDSSLDRGKPFVTKIGVNQVIRGWDEGVPQMSLGEKAILRISYDYAYGERGFPPVIPPRSDLNFEVELLKIN